MVLYINSIDFPMTHFPGSHNDYTRLVIPKGQSIKQVVERAIDRIKSKAKSNQVRRVVISSHGYPGYIHIGEGLNISNVHEFSALKAFMQPMVSAVEVNQDTGVLIDACLVASGSSFTNGIGSMMCEPGSGYEFLLNFAQAVNNKVLAPFNIQLGVDGMDYTGYEGPYAIFTPSGLSQIVDRQYKVKVSVSS